MLATLDRLADNMVWVDLRSARALERRGLATIAGTVSDELFGTVRIVRITDAGRQARDHLLSGKQA